MCESSKEGSRGRCSTYWGCRSRRSTTTSPGDSRRISLRRGSTSCRSSWVTCSRDGSGRCVGCTSTRPTRSHTTHSRRRPGTGSGPPVSLLRPRNSWTLDRVTGTVGALRTFPLVLFVLPLFLSYDTLSWFVPPYRRSLRSSPF